MTRPQRPPPDPRYRGSRYGIWYAVTLFVVALAILVTFMVRKCVAD